MPVDAETDGEHRLGEEDERSDRREKQRSAPADVQTCIAERRESVGGSADDEDREE
jgi:hypothetical protein